MLFLEKPIPFGEVVKLRQEIRLSNSQFENRDGFAVFSEILNYCNSIVFFQKQTLNSAWAFCLNFPLHSSKKR